MIRGLASLLRVRICRLLPAGPTYVGLAMPLASFLQLRLGCLCAGLHDMIRGGLHLTAGRRCRVGGGSPRSHPISVASSSCHRSQPAETGGGHVSCASTPPPRPVPVRVLGFGMAGTVRLCRTDHVQAACAKSWEAVGPCAPVPHLPCSRVRMAATSWRLVKAWGSGWRRAQRRRNPYRGHKQIR